MRSRGRRLHDAVAVTKGDALDVLQDAQIHGSGIERPDQRLQDRGERGFPFTVHDHVDLSVDVQVALHVLLVLRRVRPTVDGQAAGARGLDPAGHVEVLTVRPDVVREEVDTRLLVERLRCIGWRVPRWDELVVLLQETLAMRPGVSHDHAERQGVRRTPGVHRHDSHPTPTGVLRSGALGRLVRGHGLLGGLPEAQRGGVDASGFARFPRGRVVHIGAEEKAGGDEVSHGAVEVSARASTDHRRSPRADRGPRRRWRRRQESRPAPRPRPV